MPKLSNFSVADLIVFILCDGIGIPLCIAGGEAAAHLDYTTAVVGWGFGLPLCAVGFAFPFWKESLRTAGATWARRWGGVLVPLVILLAFAYAAGPSIYRRAVGDIPEPIGKIVWNFNPAARGGAFFLGMFKTANQGIQVVGFQAHGKNLTKEPVQKFSGWMRSDITNSTKAIYVLGQDNDESQIAACIPRIPTTFDETYGIPAFADFDVVTFQKATLATIDGISAAIFLSTSAPFTVHLEYDGAIAERQFSKEEIEKQIDLFGKITSLESVPRIVRKENATKPQFSPLDKLLKATPVPGGSQLKLISPDDQFDPAPTGGVILRPR